MLRRAYLGADLHLGSDRATRERAQQLCPGVRRMRLPTCEAIQLFLGISVVEPAILENRANSMGMGDFG